MERTEENTNEIKTKDVSQESIISEIKTKTIKKLKIEEVDSSKPKSKLSDDNKSAKNVVKEDVQLAVDKDAIYPVNKPPHLRSKASTIVLSQVNE